MREIAWFVVLGLALLFWALIPTVRLIRRKRPSKPMPWALAGKLAVAQIALAVVSRLFHDYRTLGAFTGIVLAPYGAVAGDLRRRYNERRGAEPHAASPT